MRIVRAHAMGMCFGVHDALALAEMVAEPQEVTIWGQMVHNPQVLVQLGHRGFAMVDETERAEVPPSPGVLITAHGVSDRQRQRLEAAGKYIVDCTCPLVKRAHKAAKELEAEGRLVLVIGQRDHVEVQGIVGDLQRSEVVGSEREVGAYPAGRLGIVCQTTAPADRVAKIRRAIRDRNPLADIRFIDTVCQPTKDRQSALDDLLRPGAVDAVVVIGGRNSNNTLKLVDRCRAAGLPVCHVEGPGDLDERFFAGKQAVGVTAGTSTPDEVIEHVCQYLERMGRDEATEGKDLAPAAASPDAHTATAA